MPIEIRLTEGGEISPPATLQLSEGDVAEIGGLPVAVIRARRTRLTLLVAADDGSGLIHSADEVRDAAKRLLKRLDAATEKGQH